MKLIALATKLNLLIVNQGKKIGEYPILGLDSLGCWKWILFHSQGTTTSDFGCILVRILVDQICSYSLKIQLTLLLRFEKTD